MVMASSSFDKCNLLLTYAYSTCLLTTHVCSLISLHIVNHQECFKNIITTVIFSRNHQPRRPRLPPFVMLMPFIGYHRWNGRESTNQPRSLFMILFLFGLLYEKNKIVSNFTICPDNMVNYKFKVSQLFMVHCVSRINMSKTALIFNTAQVQIIDHTSLMEH